METVSSHSTLMETAPIPKLLRKFALPSCISLIVNAMYNIVDQIFIGRGVGYLGNGATNVLLPFTVLAIALARLLGVFQRPTGTRQKGRRRHQCGKRHPVYARCRRYSDRRSADFS